MNGMQAKADRKRRDREFTPEGLPRDAKDWTETDWRDLHEAVERVKRNVARRHADESAVRPE